MVPNKYSETLRRTTVTIPVGSEIASVGSVIGLDFKM